MNRRVQDGVDGLEVVLESESLRGVEPRDRVALEFHAPPRDLAHDGEGLPGGLAHHTTRPLILVPEQAAP